MHKLILSSLICSFFLIGNLHAQGMDNEKLGKILYVMADTLAGQEGNWQFMVEGMMMVCLTDEIHNRMRIITPIKELKDMEESELKETLEANFHSALDVKYAVSEDIMWAVYIHPLNELTKDQAIDAIRQLYNASATYGTSYSSTELVFPKSEDREKLEEELEKASKPKKKKLKKS